MQYAEPILLFPTIQITLGDSVEDMVGQYYTN